MNIKAYTSVDSEKVSPSPSRKLLWEVGAKGYAETVMKLAHKPEEEAVKPVNPPAGMSEEELKTWVDTKNPSPKQKTDEA